MNDYNIDIVWQNINDELKQELVEFWLQNSNFTEEKALERAQFVSTTARNSHGKLIAIVTTVPQTIAQLENKFFIGRMIAGEEYQQQGLSAPMMMKTIEFHEKRYNEGYEPEIVGGLIQVHNPGLAEHYVKQRVIMPMGWTFIGRNAKGVPLFVRYFLKQ